MWVVAIYINVYFDTCSWLMSMYARDILSRLPQLLATCTAIFGSVLKINSTKKVCKKLQRTAAGSASWCTNVGNEKGEVLISVLTESEGLEGLRPMATGIIKRFARKFCCDIHRPLFYSGTRRPGRIPHSCCTLTEIAALSLGHQSVHSCSWSGITCKQA